MPQHPDVPALEGRGPLISVADRFNCSRFGRFLNSRSGRLFRLVAGTGFLVAGLLGLPSPVGIGLLAWSILPLSAGLLDVCWISAALGGPVSGRRIRALWTTRADAVLSGSSSAGGSASSRSSTA